MVAKGLGSTKKHKFTKDNNFHLLSRGNNNRDVHEHTENTGEVDLIQNNNSITGKNDLEGSSTVKNEVESRYKRIPQDIAERATTSEPLSYLRPGPARADILWEEALEDATDYGNAIVSIDRMCTLMSASYTSHLKEKPDCTKPYFRPKTSKAWGLGLRVLVKCERCNWTSPSAIKLYGKYL